MSRKVSRLTAVVAGAGVLVLVLAGRRQRKWRTAGRSGLGFSCVVGQLGGRLLG